MKRVILGALIAALALGGFVVLADWVAVRPNGSWALLAIQPFAGVGLLMGSLSLACVGVTLCLSRRNLMGVVVALATAGFGIATMTFSVRFGHRIRMNAFADLAKRSTPLVTAIKAFEKQNDRPPESLAALVPEFMDAIPQTGLRAYRDYGYSIGTEHGTYGNLWMLWVNTPSGLPNFDRFVCDPKQNYAAMVAGGNRLERVDDWVYVHE